MTEENHIREELLKSIEETAWLLEQLKEAVADAKQVSVALYRNVQFDLTRRNSALVDHHNQIKHAIDLQQAGPPEPDYAHWARKHWTIYEAAALAAGREPESVHWDESIPLLEWLKYAVKDNRLDETMKPADFLDWFDSLGGDNFVPPKLRQAVVAHRATFSTATETKKVRIEGPNAEAEAEANIGAVKGSKKTAFEVTNVLLEYFMRSPETVPVNPDPQQPAVSYSDAQKLKGKLAVLINDPKTIQKHLDHAVRTVRQKREGVGQPPKRRK